MSKTAEDITDRQAKTKRVKGSALPGRPAPPPAAIKRPTPPKLRCSLRDGTEGVAGSPCLTSVAAAALMELMEVDARPGGVVNSDRTSIPLGGMTQLPEEQT